MGILVPAGLVVASTEPIDSRITLTKEEMRSEIMSVGVRMPDKYFALCKDNKKFYIYDKSNPIDPETGKFRMIESGSYAAGDGITIDGDIIKVTPNKFMERKAETTPNRLMAFQDNTGLIKEIPVVWDSELGKLTTSEFNATTVGGGEGKITATKLSDGVTNKTINVSDIATVNDMACKQDKLTAGENITINENNVISATGGGSSVAFDNKTIIKGQGNKYQTAVGG